uniref:Zinc finger BED domain-containing protein RICESLEEPER 2-like n=1 Tax=Hordeum vulgare subsp. vulgare TaxID=112509 RepID=A0A8I6WKK9_HORVV
MRFEEHLNIIMERSRKRWIIILASKGDLFPSRYIWTYQWCSIGKDLEKCLVEWGIDKVFSVTVDNASPNDGAVNYIKRIMNSANASIGRGEYMHMRCAAHIMNLIVTDGLKELDISVKRVRAAVKFIKNSPARITKFKKCAELEKLTSKGFLSLDVCTRWNSTYLMLKAAATYEKVFVRYEEEDPYFAIELNSDKMPGVPEPEDWDNASKMAEFLEHFYKLTLRVSASNHCTSHIFFHQIADIVVLLRAWCGSGDFLRRDMGERMIDKYNKYWGDHKSFNILIFVAVALDLRYKLSNYIKIATFEMFGDINGDEVWTKMNATLNNLFKEYFKLYGPSEHEIQPDDAPDFEESSCESLMSSLIAKKMRMNDCGIGISPCKSELEKYLTEDNEANSRKFNILEWWKVNSSRFPVLSRLARDVLAFPISMVASESAFSTGGRILDDFRSSLTPFMVQALLCTQDWLRREIPVNDEEDAELLANLEQDVLQELSDLNIAKSGTSASVRITIDDTES